MDCITELAFASSGSPPAHHADDGQQPQQQQGVGRTVKVLTNFFKFFTANGEVALVRTCVACMGACVGAYVRTCVRACACPVRSGEFCRVRSCAHSPFLDKSQHLTTPIITPSYFLFVHLSTSSR